MRNDPLKIVRTSADKLTRETWGFEVRFPASYEIREGGEQGQIRVVLVSYEHASRESPKHRKFTANKLLLFGAYYPNRSTKAAAAWFDLTRSGANGYAWAHGDLRSCSIYLTAEVPPLPADVEADAYNRLRPVVVVAAP